jgi:hypothetical protein
VMFHTLTESPNALNIRIFERCNKIYISVFVMFM